MSQGRESKMSNLLVHLEKLLILSLNLQHQKHIKVRGGESTFILLHIILYIIYCKFDKVKGTLQIDHTYNIRNI